MKYILWNMKVGCKSIGIKNKALVNKQQTDRISGTLQTIIHIKEMTDSEFQQTKRILLEQERMNREYTQLANYIQERLSVQVINVTCTKREDSINLTLWFKYENEANSFYKERFVVDSRKRNAILKQFKQIANVENKSICLSYQAFETLAKEEANNSITQLEILELKENCIVMIYWEISRCLANVAFFLV